MTVRSELVIGERHRALQPPRRREHRGVAVKVDRRSLTALAAGALLAAALPASGLPASGQIGGAGRDAIAAAVADPTRPAKDVARDSDRKPDATLRFIGVRPGDRIADYASGSGYFTRLFSAAVGPDGRVYASVPSALLTFPNIVSGLAETQTWSVRHPNVTVTFGSALAAARYPEPLDIFWIGQNYHDLLDDFMGPLDIARFNRAVYAALKPGGYYVILDHVAAAGSPADVTDTLHRIAPALVRRQVEAAGFEYVGASRALANPSDPHTAGVFDHSIRGRTDQFLLKFRKPRKPAR
jgi:predicted methyltransferase